MTIAGERSPDGESRARLAEISASREHLDLANASARCGHIKADGRPCGSPALRGGVFCYYHDRYYNRPDEDSFPPLEDANAVQVALNQVLDRLRAEAFKPGAFDLRLMNSLLYGLQTASANVQRTRFDSFACRQEMVTDVEAPANEE